jgi:Zn-finger nucleic acid-binding protein
MREAAMNCPSCGAPLRAAGGIESLRCDYCKNFVYTAPDDEGVSYLEELEELLCPVCAIPLWNATLTNISIRACKKCHGRLVAMDIFEELIGRLRTEHPGSKTPVTDDGSDEKRRLDCPVCHRHMETHFYYGGGHVVMEDCERCELNWLDGGALLRLAHAPHTEETVD